MLSSLWSKRGKLHDILQERVSRLSKTVDDADSERQALEEAMRALAEVPKTSEPGEYALEYRPACPAFVEKGHCSVCGKSSIGWDESWAYCPVCGNGINVKRESLDEQNSRTSIEAVHEALSR